MRRLACIAALLLAAACGTDGPAVRAPVTPLLDLREIAGRSPATVAQALGPPDRVGEEGGHPRHVYRGGEVEVVFVRGLADWITYKPRAVPYDGFTAGLLGLPDRVRPTFANNFVRRWEGVAGLREVSVFSDGSGGVHYVFAIIRTKP